MYFPFFIAYMLVGFAITLAVFYWALNNGQFNDQQRARFLPLEDGAVRPVSVKLSMVKRIETYTLFFLAGCGLLATAIGLAVIIARAKLI
jgi:cbb3-type cytochrome oxidase maturation protein